MRVNAPNGTNEDCLERNIHLKFDRPRARRFSFVAKIELTDLQAETHVAAQTVDLSLFGCHLETEELLLTGTTVMLRIIHAGANVLCLGKVAYALHGLGMGIAFTQVEPSNQLVLEKWIEQLRKAQEGTNERVERSLAHGFREQKISQFRAFT